MAGRPRQTGAPNGRPPKHDWAAIERDFRDSTLTLERIAEKHRRPPAKLPAAEIRRRAKREGWTRPDGAPPDIPKPMVGGPARGAGWGGPAKGPGMPAPPTGEPESQDQRDARKILQDIAADASANVNARVAAASALVRAAAGDDRDELSRLSDEALRDRLAEVQQQLADIEQQLAQSGGAAASPVDGGGAAPPAP
jgi:hypothetical protein